LDYPTASDLVNTAWWEQFQDPVLNELIKCALNENKDVRVAAARVEEFAGRLQAVKSGFYPDVNYGTSAIRSRRSSERATFLPQGDNHPYTTLQILSSVSWELDIWGRLRRSTEAARADLLAAEENRQAVILTLVSEVAVGYISLLGLDQMLLTVKETLASRDQFLRLFERKLAGGQISNLELSQVRSSYEQVAENIPKVELQIALQENALSVLLGRSQGTINRGKTLGTLGTPEITPGIPSQLLSNRPDIRQSEQNLIAANARIGVARTQYFPSLSLTGLAGFASPQLSDLLKGTSNLWQVGAGAAGPIFSGGRIKGEIRQAESQQLQLLNTYLSTIENAFREVNDALVGIQKIKELLVAQGNRISALKDNVTFARNRYDAKYASYLEVVDAERNLFFEELSHVQTQNSLCVAMVDLYKALGGGWVAEADRQIVPSGQMAEGHKN